VKIGLSQFFEMDPVTLEEEIAELKDRIRRYERILDKALAEGNNEHIVLFADLLKINGQLLLQREEERKARRGNFKMINFKF
jgi:hypothetical protein